jgi:hypothetical protein
MENKNEQPAAKLFMFALSLSLRASSGHTLLRLSRKFPDDQIQHLSTASRDATLVPRKSTSDSD